MESFQYHVMFMVYMVYIVYMVARVLRGGGAGAGVGVGVLRGAGIPLDFKKFNFHSS